MKFRKLYLPEQARMPVIHGFPKCAKCSKRGPDGAMQFKDVEEILVEEDEPTHITVRVKCHGGEDVIKVRLTDQHRWRQLCWGLAFADGKGILMALDNSPLVTPGGTSTPGTIIH